MRAAGAAMGRSAARSGSLVQLFDELQDVRALGDGVVRHKGELRGVPELQAAPQLPPQVAPADLRPLTTSFTSLLSSTLTKILAYRRSGVVSTAVMETRPWTRGSLTVRMREESSRWISSLMRPIRLLAIFVLLIIAAKSPPAPQWGRKRALWAVKFEIARRLVLAKSALFASPCREKLTPLISAPNAAPAGRLRDARVTARSLPY